MTWLRSASLAALLAAACGCNSLLGIELLSADGGASTVDAGRVEAGGDAAPLPVANKVDLLFVISNNPSMGATETLLYLALPQLVTRLVTPDCIDAVSMEPSGRTSDDQGNCPSGSTVEFAPVHDLHIGILSSSLGDRGSGACPAGATNPANPALAAHNNDNGELINRGGMPGNEAVETQPGTSDAPSPQDFLSYFPAVSANQGHPTPPTPPVTSSTKLVADFQTLVAGVHIDGCAFTGQNEAWYRFLVQPDPYKSITEVNNVSQVTGIDETLLQQRAAFLRPDSLLAVIVVTDYDDRVSDPLTIRGQGWAFEAESFPGSQSGGGAPEGTVECQNLDPNDPLTTGPNDPRCQSCAFIRADPNFETECPQDGTSGNAGYLDPVDDNPNLRFWHQKERFGLFSGYPTNRYIRGLQQTSVPSSVGLEPAGGACHASSDCAGTPATPSCTGGVCTSDREHDDNGNYLCDPAYDLGCGPGDAGAGTPLQANCVNPIYAQNLPTSASGELCHLTPGPRSPALVYYAAIAGVPHQLLQATPGGTGPGEVDSAGNPICPAGTPSGQCLPKDTLSAADWELVMGKDPAHYDVRGADFHMVQSWAPRTTNTGLWANVATATSAPSACPLGLDESGEFPVAPPGCDPINGAEFDTRKEDLEFACTFPLVQLNNGTIEQVQNDCTNPMYGHSCSCQSILPDFGSQLCSATTPTLQVNGGAKPSIDEMIIAHAMATEVIGGQTYVQGSVASICPIAFDVGRTVVQAQQDPLFGYNPAINPIVNRLKKSIGSM